MALDANILAGLMSSKIEDIAYQYREAEKSPNDAHFAMASAIVDHIDQASDAVSEDDLNDRLDPIIGDIGDINNSVDELRDDIKSNFDDILATRDRLDGEFKPQLNLEVLNRKETDKELFKTTSSLANLRQRTAEFEDNITNAVFEVDPDNGTFNLRAYSYTDNAFTQAGLLIDGVEGQVTIQAGRITDLGNAVQEANASIDVLAGEIELRATYTEMTEFVSGALDAIIPAYSFGFFNSPEGWSAVNGTLTQGNGFISCTIGDIENRNLSYSADDNPIITIVTTRTQGTGFVGDLIVYYESDIPRIYSGVLNQKEIDSRNVQNLNLAEEPTYTGVVTGIQLVLGETADDIFEVDNITIGKPSAQLEALEGITAKVNKLGIDIDAIEGEITTFVTTTFYEENTVTLNNVTQVLDGEEAIISFKATQTELNDQGTVDKANTAAIWVNGADANIRTSVVSFNAEEGGIDDQIAGITGSLDVINQELSTIDGARIRSNLLSINKLQIESGNLEEAQFYTELKLLDQRNNDLKIGDSVAIVDTQVKTLATDQSATAQEILELKASTGTIEGQVNANSTRIQQAQTDISGNASAIAGLTTQVQNTQNDLSQAELLLDSTIDDLGVVSSRAYLGVSDVVGGKREITGVTFNSQDNGIRFKGDIFELANTNGQTALYWNSTDNKWVFDGKLIIGGYTVESEADIRGLDGTDGQVGAGFYGSTYTSISWTTSTANSRFTSLVGRPPVNGDIFTQTRTDGADSQARQYNGSSWVAVALQVNGSIVASGTIAGDKLIAGTEISAPRIVGGEIITNTGTGTRGEYYDDGTYLQWLGSGNKTDANGVFWIKRDGTGFIKGEFFQGEIIATEAASFSVGSAQTGTGTVTYNSNGKVVTLTARTSLNITASGDRRGDESKFKLVVSIKRGTTVIESYTVYPPSGVYINEPEVGINETVFALRLSDFAIDTHPTVGSRSYTITAVFSETAPYSYSSSSLSGVLKVEENLLA